jgi:hypothetical protein
MKTTTQFFTAVLMMVSLSCMMHAQVSHEKFLSKPTSQTFINEIIKADVDGSGNRLDSNRVYVLERGGTWFFNGKVENIGWTLHLKASDGDGPRPIIYNVANKLGSITGDMFQANGDVILENLTINGLADYDPKAYDEQGFAGIIVIMKAAGYDLTIDGCVILNSGSALLRTTASTGKVSITNSIFSNYGQMPKKSTTNGRVIDLRGVSCDSLIMVNNTFVNGYDRVVRHAASTGALKNMIFDHNTIINCGGSFGTLGLGLVGDKIQITNNIFVDPMAFGADTNIYRQNDFKEMNEYHEEAGKTDKLKMTWIYHQKEETPSVETDWVIENNYWNVTSGLQAAFDNIKAQWNPGLEGIGKPMSDYITSKVTDVNKAFIKEGFTFTNAPKDMSGMVLWHHKPIAQGGAGGKDTGTGYVDYDKKTGKYYSDTMDCSYPTSLAAYTGATGNYPVGDLNWFPTMKALWMEHDTLPTSINNLSADASLFNLKQNYPNPFSEVTQIAFELAQPAFVTITVLNTLGQTVETLVSKNLVNGHYEIGFNAAHIDAGIYFYRLEVGNQSVLKKMILMK